MAVGTIDTIEIDSESIRKLSLGIPERKVFDPAVRRPLVSKPEWGFFVALGLLASTYVGLLTAMVLALMSYTTWNQFIGIFSRSEILASAQLTFVSATLATLSALIVGVAIAYGLTRLRIPAGNLVDAILDLPHVMPPLVLGLSLLVLFQYWPLSLVAESIVYQVPAVFLAQFVVAASISVPMLRNALGQSDVRAEQVAAVLGYSRLKILFHVTLPQIRNGFIAAAAVSWARCIGTFGPLLVFAGATRRRTEVLATSIYLEWSVGELQTAVAVSMLLILVAASVLVLGRLLTRSPCDQT